MHTASNMLPSDAPPASKLPLWLKIVTTAFDAVLIPAYWYHYGFADSFLWFSSLALFITAAALWLESPRSGGCLDAEGVPEQSPGSPVLRRTLASSCAPAIGTLKGREIAAWVAFQGDNKEFGAIETRGAPFGNPFRIAMG